MHIEYALRVSGDVLYELPAIGVNLTRYSVESKIEYGQPFVLDQDTNIPILIEDNIVALLTICDNGGELSWVLSSELSDALNQLIGKTNENSPASLHFHDGILLATVNDSIIQLTGEVNEKVLWSNYKVNGDKVNLLLPMPFDGVLIRTIRYQPRDFSSNYLDLDLKEIQTSEAWCSAFVTAQILRYIGKGDIRARNIMLHFYPNSPNLEKEALSVEEAIAYAYRYNSYPTYSYETLAHSEVRNQIDNRSPIYLFCRGTSAFQGCLHAVLLRGYTRSSYSIWNPWNRSYISISTNCKCFPVKKSDGRVGSYEWERTAYGWR